MVTNREIARILNEIAARLSMDEVPFKPRAYERAAEAVENLGEEAVAIYARGGIKSLREIPGVGVAIAEKMEELVRTGRLAYLATLRKAVPVDLADLFRVEGLGPKGVKTLWERLKVKNRADLARAIAKGTLARVPGFGERKAERLTEALAHAEKHVGRFPLHDALPLARNIAERLRAVPGVLRVEIAGSIRRRKETAGDMDFLAIAKNPKVLMDAFAAMPEVESVLGKGRTKTMVTLKNGMDADLRVVNEASWGAALNYFTGSRAHNVALRELAQQRGWKLNEYGLWRGATPLSALTEEALYARFGLAYVPPELREGEGELQAAQQDALPRIVELADIKGDLQVQTDWSDGKDSVEAMARAGAARGFSYILITDHTASLTIAHGLDAKRLARQHAHIAAVNKKLRAAGVACTVLKGTECDIRRDGTLDLPDAALAACDIVGISVHSHTNMHRADMTARIIRAMENPHADILLHPTGRIVGAREPYDVDVDAIMRAAVRTGTVLEVNASSRLDLGGELVRKALALGVPLAVSTDAHGAADFSWLEYGVGQARRGWAQKRDIVNTLPLPKLLALFAKPKAKRFTRRAL